MTKVAIVGSGLMAQPMVDYFINDRKYAVVILDQIVSKAEDIIAGRDLGKAVSWLNNDPDTIDLAIKDADIVISMVPKPVHIYVAKSCLRMGKNMITTAYEIPELLALEEEVTAKGLLIINELGEVPGLDHFGTQMLLDEIKEENGRVISLKSYGSGLPAFGSNNNPMGYKFSWDPRTVFVAAQTAAAYLENGKRIEVAGDKLFEHFHYVEVEGLGVFESYPNKSVEKYVGHFGLDKDVSFYRGLLRYSGYCNNMSYFQALGLFQNDKSTNFDGLTYRQFTASVINAKSTDNIERSLADYLNIDFNADIVHRLKWLGFFDDRPIALKSGTNLDVLLQLMLDKMYYKPNEKDMIILHVNILAEFPDGHREKRLATMVVEGIPGSYSAMSRAVALPAAITARLVLEGKIKATGLKMPPTLPELYKPVLEEMRGFGYEFKRETIIL
ncbi:MAG: saccharopine dehydrogenase NADP-binding domain-containing protein, partial [Chlorobi bacterium]|nr:saccharopine dehydrogenase NADP-binding domain-containing protein [Chlorobiota bacterium]